MIPPVPIKSVLNLLLTINTALGKFSSDMEKIKHFYESVMEQKIMMDLGAELIGAELPGRAQPNNFQLYFEVEDLDYWQDKISNTEEIDFF